MSDGWGESSEESLLQEVRDDGVAILTLNRPAKMNAWTPAMGARYFDALEACAAEEAVRVILVTGAGKAFCAGADVGGLDSMAKAGGVQPERDPRPYWFPMSIGKPVVAAINGPCFGVGLQQALCCDVRFVARGARLSTAYAKRGLIAEVGISWVLARQVGAGRSLDLLLSARTFDGAEAATMGLAEYCTDDAALFDEALAYCTEMARDCSPWALRTMKLQLYADLMSSLDEAYDRSEELLQQALSGPDFAEGVSAFLDKRPIAFSGLSADLATLDIHTGE